MPLTQQALTVHVFQGGLFLRYTPKEEVILQSLARAPHRQPKLSHCKADFPSYSLLPFVKGSSAEG